MVIAFGCLTISMPSEVTRNGSRLRRKEVTRIVLGALLAAALVLVVPSGALAETLRVPGDFSTIQGAVDAAGDGDKILVAPGVYHESVVWENKRLVLRGAGLPNTILDPGGDGRCLTLTGVPEQAEIEGITCRNGVADTGGGFLLVNSSPTIEHCDLHDNTATSGPGGGIASTGGGPTIRDSIFTDNTAPETSLRTGRGGAIYLSSGANATVEACTFSGNRAGIGRSPASGEHRCAGRCSPTTGAA